MSYGAIGAVSAAHHSTHPVQITDKHLIAIFFVALVAIGIYLAVDKKSGLGGALAGVSALGGSIFAFVEYREFKERSSLREWLTTCGYQ